MLYYTVHTALYLYQIHIDINVCDSMFPVNTYVLLAANWQSLTYCVPACISAQNEFKQLQTLSGKTHTKSKIPISQSKMKLFKEIQSCPYTQTHSHTCFPFHFWHFCPNKIKRSLITDLNSCSLDLLIQWINWCAHLIGNIAMWCWFGRDGDINRQQWVIVGTVVVVSEDYFLQQKCPWNH